MPSLHGRNPYKFTLGAISLGGLVLFLVLIVLVEFTPRGTLNEPTSIDWSGAFASVAPFTGSLTVFAFLGWLVVGALIWGPPRADEPPHREPDGDGSDSGAPDAKRPDTEHPDAEHPDAVRPDAERPGAGDPSPGQ